MHIALGILKNSGRMATIIVVIQGEGRPTT